MLIQLVEEVLRLGCGLSLESLVRSERFSEVMVEQGLVQSQMSEQTDEALATRAGHIQMTTLLNTLSETEALIEAKRVTTHSRVDVYNRALVQTLGENIVSAAEQCLPDEAITLADEWRNATAKRQLEICQELFWLLRHDGQNVTGVLSMDSIWKKLREERERVEDARAWLPRLYGKWDKKLSPANCQGVCQMLVAFARRAGARVLIVDPIQSSSNEILKAKAILRDEIVADLIARGLFDADASFAESISASYPDETIRSTPCFHATVVLELQDGRWVLVDPYYICWGVLSAEWDLPEIFRKLEKYRQVLPGLTLLGHDHGRTAGRIQELLQEALSLVERSRRIESDITEIFNLPELIAFIAASEDFDIFIRYDAAEQGEEAPILPDDEDIRLCLAIKALTGEDFLDLSSMFDQDLFLRCKKLWLTVFHATAMNLLKDSQKEQGELPHPVCEFQNPEFGIGLSVLNSLCCSKRVYPDDFRRLFLENSANQLALFNAISLTSQDEYTEAAVRVIESLPFRHPLCIKRLRLLGR